jgi:glutathione peroxidase-family protein
VVIIVNTASQCGFTNSNYTQLKEILDKYKEKGLEVAAFPCNQFGKQEPGCDVDIKNFVKVSGFKIFLRSKIISHPNLFPFRISSNSIRTCIPRST